MPSGKHLQSLFTNQTPAEKEAKLTLCDRWSLQVGRHVPNSFKTSEAFYCCRRRHNHGLAGQPKLWWLCRDGFEMRPGFYSVRKLCTTHKVSPLPKILGGTSSHDYQVRIAPCWRRWEAKRFSCVSISQPLLDF